VVTAADPSIPNAHVITEGANIDVATATGLVTISATPSGADHQIQFNNGGAFGAFTLGGDATVNTATGVLTIASHAVSNAKFRQSVALSVVGNSTNATADVADIAAASDFQVLRRAGTAIGFGAVNLAAANAVTGVLAFGNGGTGQSSYTDGQLLIGNTSTGGLSKATLTAGTNVTITNAGGSITINASGGTGTVSSVGLSLPGIFTVSGSPVTTSGTLTGTLATQTANLVWAGPTTGAAAAPTFRSLVTADFPNAVVTLAKIANAAANTRFLGSGSSGSGSAYAEQTISAGAGIVITPGASGISIAATGTGTTAPLTQPQGRLTLVTGVPVMLSDQSAKGTIYWTPYIGNQAPVYNGATWDTIAAASDVTYTLAAGSHLSTGIYDLFLYNNAGALALGTSPAWTNTTTRSNAISLFSGIWTNTSSITLTVSGGGSTTAIAANRATYVGSFYATANGQTSFVAHPAFAVGGNNNFLALYNAYNRIRVGATNIDNTNSWTYAVATWRAANNSLSNRITFLDGLGQSHITARYGVNIAPAGGGGNGGHGVSLNSSTAAPITYANSFYGPGVAANYVLTGFLSAYPVLGLNYVQAMEISFTGTTTFFGGNVNLEQLALEVEM
jgi:hypothetical protein